MLQQLSFLQWLPSKLPPLPVTRGIENFGLFMRVSVQKIRVLGGIDDEKGNYPLERQVAKS